MAPPDLTPDLTPGLAAPARGVPRAALGADARLWLAAGSLPWLAVWLFPPLNHDVAALLLFTERWFEGERLYRDLVDLNPPMVFLLYAVPVALARWGMLPLAASFTLCLVVFCAAVGAMAWRRAMHLAPGRAQALLLAALLPAAILGVANTMGGQREHLLAVALLPWLFDAARRAHGPVPARETFPAALLAALFLCLKPHFLAVPLLVEGALLAWRGWPALRDPVPYAFALVPAAFAAVTLLLFPSYLADIVPLILGPYVAFGEATPLDVLLARGFAPTLLVLLAGAALALWRGDRLARLLALAAIGATAGAALQAKGWPYHYLPAEIFTLLLAGRLAGTWLDRLSPAPGQALGFAVAALVALNAHLLAVREGPWRQLIHASEPASAIAAEIAARAHGRPVLLLSPGVDPAYPALLEGGAFQAMRYMTVWPLQVAYARCPAGGVRYREPAAMPAEERALHDAVVADFLRHDPALVLVDAVADVPDCHGVPFDLLAYFLRDPAFAAGFARYRLVSRIDRFAIFTRGP